MKLNKLSLPERVFYDKEYKTWKKDNFNKTHNWIPGELRRLRAMEAYMGGDPDEKHPIDPYIESAFVEYLDKLTKR